MKCSMSNREFPMSKDALHLGSQVDLRNRIAATLKPEAYLDIGNSLLDIGHF